MARREVTMNEIVEMIYQWHQGAGIKSIQRSLGFHRKTIRKYVALAQSVGVSRGGTFPQETELVEKLKVLDPPGLLREAPVTDRILPHRDWIESLLEHPHMTAKQIWRLFRERTDLAGELLDDEAIPSGPISVWSSFCHRSSGGGVGKSGSGGPGLCWDDGGPVYGQASQNLGFYHDPLLQSSSVCSIYLSTRCSTLDGLPYSGIRIFWRGSCLRGLGQFESRGDQGGSL